MSPRLSNGIPIRIGNRGFLADSKRYRACLPCSVAGTREVCQDTPLPKPNGWFCPGSHFFLFLFFEHFMHMCIIDLGHFTSHFSLPTLLNPFSSSQVPLLFLCPIVGLLYIELRIACMSKGGGFFFTREHWKLASVPAVKKAPSGGHTSASALALEHFTNNMCFETVILMSSLSLLVVLWFVTIVWFVIDTGRHGVKSSLRSFCLEMLIQVSAFLAALKYLETISLDSIPRGSWCPDG